MDQTSKNHDSDIFLKTLCSSGLPFVQKQSQQLQHRKNELLDSKQKLIYNNYDSYIRFSQFSKELIDDFQTIESSLTNLKSSIPKFKHECETFSKDTGEISTLWNNVSLMLTKHPKLIEFLEIPQLLNNCIRTFYYDDAIRICDFVTKLCRKHSQEARIFENMLSEVDKCKDIMVAQIIKELSDNIQLPICMKMIRYLKQTERFNEDQLRINFLTCRDHFFQSEMNKEIKLNQTYSLNQISRITESFRINIFDIVTQYQAIFPEIESNFDDTTPTTNKYESRLINSWLLLKIQQYLCILRENLDGCLSIQTVLHLDSLLDNCFYFGLSMNKIGADIRPQLILIFSQFIERRFKQCVQLANKRFINSLGDIFNKNHQHKNAKLSEEAIDDNIENYPILINYQKDLHTIFNEIRNNVPLSLIPEFTKTLNESTANIVHELKSYMKKHEYGLNNQELQNYLHFCHSIRQLLPKLNQSYQKLFPISLVANKLGLSVLEMNNIGLGQQFEFDYKTPTTEINCLIKEINYRLKPN